MGLEGTGDCGGFGARDRVARTTGVCVDVVTEPEETLGYCTATRQTPETFGRLLQTEDLEFVT